MKVCLKNNGYSKVELEEIKLEELMKLIEEDASFFYYEAEKKIKEFIHIFELFKVRVNYTYKFALNLEEAMKFVELGLESFNNFNAEKVSKHLQALTKIHDFSLRHTPIIKKVWFEQDSITFEIYVGYDNNKDFESFKKAEKLFKLPNCDEFDIEYKNGDVIIRNWWD